MLEATAHRPWPLPQRPWIMAMRWHEVLFLHWPVRPAALRALLPAGLDLDTFDGWGWVGVVPFRMSGVRLRGLPAGVCSLAFPELNVRTYVKSPDRSGVWFFSLDAASRLAVWAARRWYGLPYYRAQMRVERHGERVHYRSIRRHRGAPPAAFEAWYEPVGEVYRAPPGTLDHWLTERYCLYKADRRGRLGYADIHHAPWPLQRARAELACNTMTQALGLALPPQAPVMHFARQLDVVAWSVRRL
jgi:uncharacterized protein YqjF (DUF2071 family)